MSLCQQMKTWGKRIPQKQCRGAAPRCSAPNRAQAQKQPSLLLQNVLLFCPHWPVQMTRVMAPEHSSRQCSFPHSLFEAPLALVGHCWAAHGTHGSCSCWGHTLWDTASFTLRWHLKPLIWSLPISWLLDKNKAFQIWKTTVGEWLA